MEKREKRKLTYGNHQATPSSR